MTVAKTKKFLRLLADTDIPTVTLMPLLVDTLKSLIPAYEVSVIHVNENTEPTTYYTEKFNEDSHDLFSQAGDKLATNHQTAHKHDPAAFDVLFKQDTPYGNLVPVTEAFLAGANYQHFFKPNGIYHALDVLIKDDDKPIAVIGLFRQKHEPAFTKKDVKLIGDVHATLCRLFLRDVKVDVPSSRRFLEKSTMVTVDEHGNIIGKAPDAMRLLTSALACKSRELLSKDNVLPASCLAFRTQVQKALSASQSNDEVQNDVYLAAPFGRLHLRAYTLAQDTSQENTTHYGIHIDFYGDIAEALLAYLRATPLSARLIEIAYLVAMGMNTNVLKQHLSLTYNSLKTYLNRLYVHFDVRDFDALKMRVIEHARLHAFRQSERRHLLMQFLRD